MFYVKRRLEGIGGMETNQPFRGCAQLCGRSYDCRLHTDCPYCAPPVRFEMAPAILAIVREHEGDCFTLEAIRMVLAP